jgi:hypothetical protein
LPLEFLPEIGEALEAIDEAVKRDQVSSPVAVQLKV